MASKNEKTIFLHLSWNYWEASAKISMKVSFMMTINIHIPANFDSFVIYYYNIKFIYRHPSSNENIIFNSILSQLNSFSKHRTFSTGNFKFG
jgi:hypothetical protein